MGKRELLLIIAFVIVGAVVYQATAPPADPNDRSFSFSRVIEHVRREIRGNRASAVITTQASISIESAVEEVRVIDSVHELEIIGEDRQDVDASLRVQSNAYDDSEAKRYGEETKLHSDSGENILTFRITFPPGRHTGRQRATLTLRVPARVRARIEARPRKLTISNLAGVEAINSSGEAIITKIAGRVAMVHGGGSVTIENAASLKFTGRHTEVTLKGITGDASIVMEQGGEITTSQLAGSVDVESRNADVTLDNLEATRGPIRVNSTNGRVRLNGIKSETRIDGRNAGVDIVMSGAAPVSIYTEGDRLALTPPPGGFRLDAVVRGGGIGSEEAIKNLGLEISNDRTTEETRASGSPRGGGPTITVRTIRGDLALRERDEQNK